MAAETATMNSEIENEQRTLFTDRVEKNSKSFEAFREMAPEAALDKTTSSQQTCVIVVPCGLMDAETNAMNSDIESVTEQIGSRVGRDIGSSRYTIKVRQTKPVLEKLDAEHCSVNK